MCMRTRATYARCARARARTKKKGDRRKREGEGEGEVDAMRSRVLVRSLARNSYSAG